MRRQIFQRVRILSQLFTVNTIQRNSWSSSNSLVLRTSQVSFDRGGPQDRKNDPFERTYFGKRNWWLVTAVGSFSVTLGLYLGTKINESSVAAASPKSDKPGSRNAEAKFQVFSREEVAKHHNMESGIWVTYKNGVYDVTEFFPKHPGADRLLMAAGSSLEPFWELYPIHKSSHVLDILAKYQIGILTETDASDASQEGVPTDAFADDPIRHPDLIILSAKPFNGETPPRALINSYYTPNALFYVRNHLPVPRVDPASYTLEVEGLHMNSKSLTLEDIKSLPRVEISATIQCAGNRRSDMHKYKAVTGLQWTGGAIGNAKWSGARLRDVLRLAGFSIENYENPQKLHLEFEGLDSDPSGESYGASIPLSYLLDGNFEPILAYEMNGETLPYDHGYPLRVILPGIVGARNVKWLGRISISAEESQSPWQQRDYKVFNPSVTLSNVDYSSSPPIIDLPVNSYICTHANGTVIPRGHSIFRGYAYAGGGRNIVRVEISTDKGKTWEVVDNLVTDREISSRGSWVLWEKDLELTHPEELEIWVKAVDSAYNQQVETFTGIWNFRGLISTAYHTIKCTVE